MGMDEYVPGWKKEKRQLEEETPEMYLVIEVSSPYPRDADRAEWMFSNITESQFNEKFQMARFQAMQQNPDYKPTPLTIVRTVDVTREPAPERADASPLPTVFAAEGMSAILLVNLVGLSALGALFIFGYFMMKKGGA